MGENPSCPHNSEGQVMAIKIPTLLKNFDKSCVFPLGALSVKTEQKEPDCLPFTDIYLLHMYSLAILVAGGIFCKNLAFMATFNLLCL